MVYLVYEWTPLNPSCWKLSVRERKYPESQVAHPSFSLVFVVCFQVRGFCVDKSNPELFDEVAVYGNIYDSELHHNNFAVYTYG